MSEVIATFARLRNAADTSGVALPFRSAPAYR